MPPAAQITHKPTETTAPAEPTEPAEPARQPGGSRLWVWALALVLLGGGMAAFLIYKKRKM